MKNKINQRFALIAALAIVLTTVLTTYVYYQIFQEEVMSELSGYAQLLETVYDERDISGSGSQYHGTDREINPAILLHSMRVTVVRADGTVLYDNRADVSQMDNHRKRPEISQALETGEGRTVRISATINQSNYYYAKKMQTGDVLRVSKETDSIWSLFQSVFPIIAVVGVLLLVFCFAASHYLTQTLLKPIEQMGENLDHLERVETYRELQPFIRVIRTQHEDILNAARMRQEFTANVSHELKTPLTSISGYAELIENGMAKKQDVKRFAGEIHANADRLLSLINDIIRLSELDSASELEVPLEKVDLYELAENCINMLELVADRHNVSMHLSGKSLVLMANKDMMEELIYNLCDNAIRYNKEGGNVWVNVGKGLTVRDDGIGISKEHQKRVFERFFRADKSRSKQTGGTGLGLAIVKHIVEIHDAKISLDSEESRGTVVEVRFDRL